MAKRTTIDAPEGLGFRNRNHVEPVYRFASATAVKSEDDGHVGVFLTIAWENQKGGTDTVDYPVDDILPRFANGTWVWVV